MSELAGEKPSFFKKVVKLIRSSSNQKSVPTQKPPQTHIAINEPENMDTALNDIPKQDVERLPPEKLIVDRWKKQDLDIRIDEEILKIFPEMPLDWRILANRWAKNGGQTDLPDDISKLRDQICQMASRQDVALKLHEFRELLRRKFGDTIPVYRGAGDFAKENSESTKFFDQNSKFTSVSPLLTAAAQFGVPITGKLEGDKLEVEVTKYIIVPEDVVGFAPSREHELFIARNTLDAYPPPSSQLRHHIVV